MWLHALRLNILKFETDQSDNSILYTKTPKFLFLRIFTHFYVLKITESRVGFFYRLFFDKVI